MCVVVPQRGLTRLWLDVKKTVGTPGRRRDAAGSADEGVRHRRRTRANRAARQGRRIFGFRLSARRRAWPADPVCAGPCGGHGPRQGQRGSGPTWRPAETVAGERPGRGYPGSISAGCSTASARRRRNWPRSRAGYDRQANPESARAARASAQLGAYVLNVKRRRRPGELGPAERLHPGRRPRRRESRMVTGDQLRVGRSRLGDQGDRGDPGPEHAVPFRQELSPRHQFRGRRETVAGQMEDIEDTICAAIGFGEHQRVSAVHQNTDHWHLHVAINKVHPPTFRNVEPFCDHYRLQECCAELEVKHGLTRTNTTEPEQGRSPAARAGPAISRRTRARVVPALDSRGGAAGPAGGARAAARAGRICTPRSRDMAWRSSRAAPGW